MNTFELDSEYIAHAYNRFPLEITGGKGSILTGKDENGTKEYIDMGSGIAVNIFGTCDKEWIDATYAQMNSFQHTSNVFYTSPCVKLAKLLCERTGMKKVFFSNSGAESNECAIKAARKYAEDKSAKTGKKHSTTIITLKNSFHGRTITTLAATGQDTFHEHFIPITEGFAYCEANNLDQAKKMVGELSPAAIMIEVVQGEGGVNALDKDFVVGLRKLCDENDVLLICDEVQIGNGRSGKLYGYMNYGIVPDVVTTAKGLAGGLPLGVTMLGEKVKDVFTPGTHGSTFGGNPICCAGALSIMSRIDDKLLDEVNAKSQYIKKMLTGAKGINSVTGMGLMLGIDIKRDKNDVVKELRDNGVLVLTAKEKIRLLPPLNIPQDTLEKAVSIIKTVCGAF